MSEVRIMPMHSRADDMDGLINWAINRFTAHFHVMNRRITIITISVEHRISWLLPRPSCLMTRAQFRATKLYYNPRSYRVYSWWLIYWKIIIIILHIVCMCIVRALSCCVASSADTPTISLVRTANPHANTKHSCHSWTRFVSSYLTLHFNLPDAVELKCLYLFPLNASWFQSITRNNTATDRSSVGPWAYVSVF